MEKIIFICYPKCTTCRRAEKWLRENNIIVQSRHIVEDTPTEKELTDWLVRSKLPVNKFFNTSGKVYKEQNIKEKVKTESTSTLIKLLISNGMLIKRPLLVSDDFVLVGFNEKEWSQQFKVKR